MPEEEKPVLKQVVQISGVAHIKKRPTLMPPLLPQEQEEKRREEERAERKGRLVVSE